MGKLKKIFIYLFPLLLLGIWYLRGLFSLDQIVNGDRPPMPPNLGAAWWVFLSSWLRISPGITLTIGTEKLLDVFYFVFTFGGSPALVQKISFLFPVFLSFVSLYWFLGKFSVGGFLPLVWAGVVFSLNPIFLGEILGGVNGTILANALLPFIVYYLYEIFYLQSVNYLKTALLGFLSFLAFTFSIHVLFLIPVFVFLFTAQAIISKKFSFRKQVAAFVSYIIFFLIFSLGNLYPYFKEATTFIIPHGKVVEEIARQTINEVRFVYQNTRLLDFILFFNGPGYEKIFGLGFPWYLGFALVPVFCLSSFFLNQNQNRKQLSRFLWVILLTIWLFIFLAHRGVILMAFEKFPPLFRFRNAARFGLLQGFAVAVLLAFVVSTLEEKLKRRALVLYLPFFVFLISLSPIFGPGVFGAGKLNLNGYYREIAQTVSPGYAVLGERNLWLPWNYEVQKIAFAQDPNLYGLAQGTGQLSRSHYLVYLRDFYKALATQNVPLINSFLKNSRINRIILDKGRARDYRGIFYRENYFTPVLETGLAETTSLLESLNSFQKEKETENFAIFKNRLDLAYFSLYDGVSTVVSDLQTDRYLYILDGFKSDLFEYRQSADPSSFGPDYKKTGVPSLILGEDYNGVINENHWQRVGEKGLISVFDFTPRESLEVLLAFSQVSGKAYFGLGNPNQSGFGFLFDGALAKIIPFGKVGNQEIERSSKPWVPGRVIVGLEWTGPDLVLLVNREEVGRLNLADGVAPSREKVGLVKTSDVQVNLLGFRLRDVNLEGKTVAAKEGSVGGLGPVSFRLEGINRFGLNRPKITDPGRDYYLLFNEPYDSGWLLKAGRTTITPFLANGWANGYKVSGADLKNPVLKIYFKPQGERYLILTFSALVLVSLLYGLVKYRRYV